MKFFAAIVRELTAAGVTGDALVTAIQRLEKARDACDVTVTPGALRMRKYRKKRKELESAKASLPCVTGDKRNIDSPTLDKKVRKISSARIPVTLDWVVCETDRAYAKSKGWDDHRINSEGERFRDHHVAKGSLFKNISAAWRNWVTSPYQQATGARNGAAKSNASRRGGSLLDAIEEVRSGLAGGQDENSVLSISPGRLPGPEGFHGANGDGLGELRPADRRLRDEPTNGHPEEIEISSEHRGSG